MSVDNVTGAVSMTCTPVYEVSATVTGGSLIFLLDDLTIGLSATHSCGPVTSCSTLMPKGHHVRVIVTGTPNPFRFTCPGGSQQDATWEHGFNGTCETASLSGDFVVTANIP